MAQIRRPASCHDTAVAACCARLDWAREPLDHAGSGADAFIVAPGGIGTVLETLMIWQLVQVHHLQNTPLILVGKMWPGLIEWARTAMLSFDPPLANAEDMTIPQCVPGADQAIAVIREHYAKWQRE